MISIENITKSFPGLFHPVLDHMTLSIQKGETCVLLGANGSGKSTLLKMISGDVHPDEGCVRLQGRVAQVSQNVQLGTVGEMTLMENLILSCSKNQGFQLYARHENAMKAILRDLPMDLEKFFHSPVKNLSGGQRQLVATLMALHTGADILLLDEHTSALDPGSQKFLMRYTLQKIRELGLTTLLITHKMEEALQYGDRLLMLHQGKIVLDMAGEEKKSLTVSHLLTLFHSYEDQTLTQETTKETIQKEDLV